MGLVDNSSYSCGRFDGFCGGCDVRTDAGYHESSADEESGVFGSFEIGELDDDEDEEPLDDDLEDDEFTDSEIICPNCGAVIGYGETECSECGTKL